MSSTNDPLIRQLKLQDAVRYMKSLLVSVFWPTREWIQAPHRRWIFTTYAESLSIKHAMDRRTILQSPWYQRRWDIGSNSPRIRT